MPCPIKSLPALALSIAILLVAACMPTQVWAQPKGPTAKIPPPKFPSKDREAGHHGSVRVSFQVDASGRLVSAEVVGSSGWKGLDQAALDAVRQGRYSAGTDDSGTPIDSTSTVSIEFGPPDGPPEDNEAQLRKMLDMTCAQYLAKLAADPSPGRDQGYGYSFGWPLLQFEQLYASRGKKVELLPRRQAIYRRLMATCSASPDSPAYDAYADAAR